MHNMRDQCKHRERSLDCQMHIGQDYVFSIVKDSKRQPSLGLLGEGGFHLRNTIKHVLDQLILLV